MKKYRLLFIVTICLIIPYIVLGIDKDSTGVKAPVSISIHAGVGIPASYSDPYIINFTNDARSGPFINMYATLPIRHTRFDFAGMLGYGSNAFYLPHSIYEGVDVTSLQAGNYNIGTVLIGVCLKLPLAGIALIHFRVLVGHLYFKTPEVIYNGTKLSNSPYYPNIVGTWDAPAQTNNSFCYDIGISVKFMFSKRFFGMLNADMLHSGIADMYLVNITAGVGYRL